MTVNHLNAGAPMSSTAGLNQIEFSDVPSSEYNREVVISSSNLANLLGVEQGESVYVGNQRAENALDLLDDNNVSFSGKVYEGTNSWAGVIGDELWGTVLREHN